jgi:hypothetical protein
VALIVLTIVAALLLVAALALTPLARSKTREALAGLGDARGSSSRRE